MLRNWSKAVFEAGKFNPAWERKNLSVDPSMFQALTPCEMGAE